MRFYSQNVSKIDGALDPLEGAYSASQALSLDLGKGLWEKKWRSSAFQASSVPSSSHGRLVVTGPQLVWFVRDLRQT